MQLFGWCAVVLVVDRRNGEASRDALEREEHCHAASKRAEFDHRFDIGSVEKLFPEGQIVPHLGDFDSAEARTVVCFP